MILSLAAMLNLIRSSFCLPFASSQNHQSPVSASPKIHANSSSILLPISSTTSTRSEGAFVQGRRKKEVGRQHQGTDRFGVRKVPEGGGEQRLREETGCEVIIGAPTIAAVTG